MRPVKIIDTRKIVVGRRKGREENVSVNGSGSNIIVIQEKLSIPAARWRKSSETLQNRTMYAKEDPLCV